MASRAPQSALLIKQAQSCLNLCCLQLREGAPLYDSRPGTSQGQLDALEAQLRALRDSNTENEGGE